MQYNLTELARLLENIVRIGTVFDVDINAEKVRIKDGQGWDSNWLSWGAVRAGDDKDWAPYSKGEQVAVVCPSGDPAQAFVLCALYSDSNPAPSHNANSVEKHYRGGASFVLDKEAGTLTVNLPTKIIINSAVDLNGDLNQVGKHTSSGDQVAGGISQIDHYHTAQGATADTSKAKKS